MSNKKLNQLEKELNRALKAAPVQQEEMTLPLHAFLQANVYQPVAKLFDNPAQPFLLLYYTNMEIAHSHGIVPFGRSKAEYEKLINGIVHDMTRMFSSVKDGASGYLMIATFASIGNLDMTNNANIIDAFLENPHTCYIQLTARGTVRRIGSRTGRVFSTSYVTPTVFHVHDDQENYGFVHSLRQITDTWQTFKERQKAKETPVVEPLQDATVPANTNTANTIEEKTDEGKATAIVDAINSARGLKLQTVAGETLSVTMNGEDGTPVTIPFNEHLEKLWTDFSNNVNNVITDIFYGNVEFGTVENDFLNYDSRENAVTVSLPKFTNGDSENKFGIKHWLDIMRKVVTLEKMDVLYEIDGTEEGVLQYLQEAHGMKFEGFETETKEEVSETETTTTIDTVAALQGN